MKKIIFLCMIFLLLSPLLFSHEYIMNDNISYTTPWTNITISTLTSGDWDDGYYDLALPSDNQIYFYGKKVTHIRIWTNGYVTFGYGSPPTDYSDSSNDRIPWNNQPNGYAAPWWDDWDLTSKGSITYTVTTNGPSSNNWVTIAWNDIPHKYDATASYDFQIVIKGHYSSPDTSARRDSIIFNYTDTDSGTGTYDYGISGTIGIEDPTGYQSEKYSYNTASINNNSDMMFTPFIPIYDSTDFWADDKPDLLIFRPSNGKWYKRSNDGLNIHVFSFGTRGDIALPGDYDGDGDADELVYRPSDGKWYGKNPTFVTLWGTEGDIPVAADFDGDGWTDLCVYRPKEGKWYINYRNGGTAFIRWGDQGDIPLPADYDNDGKADAAVYRPSDGKWYIQKSSNPSSSWVIPWGAEGDIPFPANFQSSAYSTLCVYRPSDGKWYSYNQNTASLSIAQSWGTTYDYPVPNDWNGGTITDPAVFRPSDGKWYIKYGNTVISWGEAGGEDKPRCRRQFTIVSPNYSGNDENK
jgi:hypothetical protein